MLLVTLVYDILVPEMSGDVFVRSSLPPQDGPCQVRASCEPRTPGEEGKGEGGGGGGERRGKEKGIQRVLCDWAETYLSELHYTSQEKISDQQMFQ